MRVADNSCLLSMQVVVSTVDIVTSVKEKTNVLTYIFRYVCVPFGVCTTFLFLVHSSVVQCVDCVDSRSRRFRDLSRFIVCGLTIVSCS